MYTLAQLNPLRELEQFQNRILSAFIPAVARRNNGHEPLEAAEWSPPVDLIEDENGYLISAELPEVDPADVKITMENGVLNLRGERKSEEERKNRRYHLMERSRGFFSRSFRLPNDADAQGISATFRNGVLEIQVPRSEASRPKEIEITVA